MTDIPEEKNEDHSETLEDIKLSRLQKRLVIVCLFLLLAILVIKVAEVFSDILHILAVSVFLTYTAVSLVDFLDRKLKNRMTAVLSVYLLGAVLTLVGILLVIPTILVQVTQLFELTVKELPGLIKNSGEYLKPLENRLATYDIHVRTDELVAFMVNNLPQPDGSFIMAQMSGAAISLVTLSIYGLSVLLISFYFLLDGKSMHQAMIKLAPKRFQSTCALMSSEIHTSLKAFFRGQIVLGMLFGVFMVIVYIF